MPFITPPQLPCHTRNYIRATSPQSCPDCQVPCDKAKMLPPNLRGLREAQGDPSSLLCAPFSKFSHRRHSPRGLQGLKPPLCFLPPSYTGRSPGHPTAGLAGLLLSLQPERCPAQHLLLHPSLCRAAAGPEPSQGQSSLCSIRTMPWGQRMGTCFPSSSPAAAVPDLGLPLGSLQQNCLQTTPGPFLSGSLFADRLSQATVGT